MATALRGNQCFATAGCEVRDPCGIKSLSLYLHAASQTAVTIPQKSLQTSSSDYAEHVMKAIFRV